MRTAIALLALSVSALAAPSKEIHRTLPLQADGSVEIDTFKGSIRVSTWDRAELDLSVRIEEQDEGWLSQPPNAAELRIDAHQGDIRLESYYFVPSVLSIVGSRPLFHYTLRMPRTARLQIKDYASDTEVDGLAADLELDTYKGSVRVRELAGTLRLNTYKGEVRASFASFNKHGRVETYKGHIELDLPRQAGFDLHVDLGRRANLDSDFTELVGTRSRRDGGRVSGTVNGGGPALTLKSYKGSFRLRGR
jgi:hypothetical protein